MKADNKLLSAHLALSFAKQMLLVDFLKEHNWQADLDAGKVDFGRGRIFPIQLLGSESYIEETWLWSWANKWYLEEPPLSVLATALQLQNFGNSNNIDFLKEPRFPLADVNGQEIALIASGICKASAYYRGPYDGGAVFFLIYGLPITVESSLDPSRITSTISQAISMYAVDHRLLVESFLYQLGLAPVVSQENIIANSPRGTIRVNFDESGRISEMQAQSKPHDNKI